MASHAIMDAVAKAIEGLTEHTPDAITKLMPHDSGHPPPQHQEYPGSVRAMEPQPQFMGVDYKGSSKLGGKVALITGGDSGMGRSIGMHFAKEGAKGVTIMHVPKLPGNQDARDSVQMIEAEGSAKCLDFVGDVTDRQACKRAVEATLAEFGQLDVVVNHVGTQFYHTNFLDISDAEMATTFNTNVHSMFHMVQAALPHMKPGGAIINTSSAAAFTGDPVLVDYASSKMAVISFTTSLAQECLDKGIRCNTVAPGTIWTPFIPATFPKAYIPTWARFSQMGRLGQPCEVAPAYVFLASEDSSYITGQVIHVDGGMHIPS